MHPNPLIRKLSCVTRIDADEMRLIERAFKDRGTVSRGADIISAGTPPQNVHLIVEGWAARYEMLPDGKRQITAFFIPGDLCDVHVAILGHMDHGIIAITDCRVAYADRNDIDSITSATPNLTHAIWWTTLIDEAILRQWVANNGRREAVVAIAHLLCELHARMKMIGLVKDGEFRLPLTQEELSDATGMTTVHVNRVFKALRAEGLIELEKKMLKVPDVPALRNLAGFDPQYLHIGHPPD